MLAARVFDTPRAAADGATPLQIYNSLLRIGGYLLNALVLVAVVVVLTAVFRDYLADESQQEVVTASTGAIVRTSTTDSHAAVGSDCA